MVMLQGYMVLLRVATRALPLVAGLVVAVAPLAAQKTPKPPKPPADQGCDSCDDAAQRDLERTREAVERARAALLEAREALRAMPDSEALEEAYRQAYRIYDSTRTLYETTVTRAMREQMLRAQASVRAAQRDAERQMRDAERQMQMQMRQPAPRGWLGVTFSGDVDMAREHGHEVMRFAEYPRIEAVEPDSPAEHAGIESGDLLIAIDGRDLREGTEPFGKLLQPGARLQVKVKRGRLVKPLTVVVGRRPPNAWSSEMPAPNAFPAPMPPMGGVPAVPPVAAAPAAPDAPSVAMPAAPAAPAAPAPSIAVEVMPGVSVLAGAQVQPVGELQDYFGVSDGVLVLRVLHGTPADRAGLRGGDVIVRADGRAVSTPRGLARAMERARDRTVKLDVVRKKARKSIALAW